MNRAPGRSSRSIAAICSKLRSSSSGCVRGSSRRCATRATRSTCSRSRSWPRARSTSGTSTSCARSCGGARTSASSPTTRSARRSICSPGAIPPIGSTDCDREWCGTACRTASADAKARNASRCRAAARFPTAASSACSCPMAGASASSTRRWCTRAASANASCSARRRGASRRSPSIASSSRPRPANPRKPRSGRAIDPAVRLELGRALGQLAREVHALAPADADARLRAGGLDERAASNLRRYLDEQAEATGAIPDDRTIVIERFADEIGDWRVCILTPFGSRVHAPWAMAIEERLERNDLPVQVLWSDDGIILRLPEALDSVATELLLPDPDELDDLIVARLPSTSLFASKFRENAARALLLPRRRPGERTPLWQQRQRAADLLEVASGYPSFPMLLETTARMHARHLRRRRVARSAQRHSLAQGADRAGRDPPRVAVRAVAAVRVDRGLHVRGRRAARRTPRRRPRARPRSPARPHGRRGTARAPRSRRARTARARTATPRSRTARPPRRRPARSARRSRPVLRSTSCAPGARAIRRRGWKRSSPNGASSSSAIATPRPRTRRDCATRSGSRSRKGCRSRSPIRSSARSTISSPATRARTFPSSFPTCASASAFRSNACATRWCASNKKAASCTASSGPAASSASGATPAC